jgi:hypothetical protein
MAKPPKSWRNRPQPRPWKAEEDRVIIELTALGVGLHQHVLDASLPGRTFSEVIDRRLALREGENNDR